MLRHFYLLGLSLLIYSCGKDSPAPVAEPDLKGRWNVESVVGFNYDANGQLLGQVMHPNQEDYYLVVTADSVHYHDIRNGNSWGRHGYTLKGQKPQLGRNQVTIFKLADHALTLRFKDVNHKPAAPYQEVEEYYTR